MTSYFLRSCRGGSLLCLKRCFAPPANSSVPPAQPQSIALGLVLNSLPPSSHLLLVHRQAGLTSGRAFVIGLVIVIVIDGIPSRLQARARLRLRTNAADRPKFSTHMVNSHLTVCFARRGYSGSGGAESYLKRLGEGVAGQGYRTRLFTTDDWPKDDRSFGQVVWLGAKTPLGFANELEKLRENARDEVLISLERVCRCDVYRAGDGVHQAWLNRRGRFEPPWRTYARRFRFKHREIVRLEESLMQERRAERIIANSRMVKYEIVDLYNYRRDMIDVVPNGIPLQHFRYDPELRTKARAELGLGPQDIALLFAGSGWERKGLRFAIKAIIACEDPKLRLLVAGRGNTKTYAFEQGRFLGELTDLRPAYAAADVFILPTIYDPFSNACLEAMASGLPVITTRANGFCEAMEDRIHGSLVDQPDDIDDLKSAIQAWSDPTRRQVARPSILKRAAEFDISRNVERTLQIVLQSAARASSTPG